jgi:uncharacterized lipoprotein YmbA
MNSKAQLPIACLVAALLLAGCGSAPPVRLHSLLSASAPTPRVGEVPVGSAPLMISLGPVGVPAQVDQPQWLVRLPDDTLALLEQDRWAAPLRDELRDALLDVLGARWGAVEVRGAAPDRAAVWRIVVDVSRFESVPAREARLESRWSVTASQGGAASAACRSVIREAVTEGMAALAQGHRRAVARLADEIGQQLLALQRGERVRCADAAAAPT